MAEWYLFAIASALISGLVPSVNKAILNDGEALEFSTVLSVFNAVLSLPLILLVSLSIPAKPLLLLFVGSAFGTLGFLYISRSMKTLDVSVVSPLTNFNPVVLVVLASLVLGEKLVPRQLLGILLVLLGAYLLERSARVSRSDRTGKGAAVWAFALAFASAVFYGFSSLVDKTVLAVISPLQYLLLAHIFIAVNFAVLSGVWQLRRAKKLLGLLERKKWLFISSSMLTIAYRLLQATAVSLAPVSLVIPIRHLGSLVSTAVGGRLFKEEKLAGKLAIGAMMLAGTYFIIL